MSNQYGNRVTTSNLDRQDRTAAQILQLCKTHRIYLAAAESLTGGLLADAFVRISGASQVFLGSAVTYDLAAKAHLLQVDPAILARFGAVCEPVARAMALGTVKQFTNDSLPDETGRVDSREGRVIGLSTTGVAGPGPDGIKPAGAVFIGIACPRNFVVSAYDVSATAQHQDMTYMTHVWRLALTGDREQVRRGVVQAVLDNLLRLVQRACDET